MNSIEWELYSSRKGAKGVASKLSTAATKGINEANKVYAATKDKKAASLAAWNVWEPVSISFSDFGANDSEPRYHFEHLLAELFYKPNGIN